MASVITAPCTGCGECVPACPVDCIHPAVGRFYIDPDGCICCAGCLPTCPENVIFDESELPSHLGHFAAENRRFFAVA